MKVRYSLFFLILFSVTSWAASSPTAMLQSTTQEVIGQLKANGATLQSNPKIVYNIMKNSIVPHFNLQGMARSVVPRNTWMQASPQQRSQFTQQFTNLLIRTYSSALASYRNEEVKYLPMRAAAGNQVQIDSQIIRQSGPSISVSYRLVRIGSDWKINDFSVDGISLLQSYRSQFSAVLSSGGSMNDLIQKLSQHNA